jgi:hypothetical protein
MTGSSEQGVSRSAAWNLLMGPILGLIYVITLPFIAIGTMIVLLGKKLIGGMFNLLGSLVSFGWRPTEAHLAGKKKDKKREHKADDS